MKLHLGCGEDYREGYLNVDNNRRVKANAYIDLGEKIPFGDDMFEYVYADAVIEHIPNVYHLMEELWRICKPNAIIEIIVPHYTGMFGRKYLGHYHEFGIGSFDCFSDNDASSQDYTSARFKIMEERLSLFKINARGTRYPVLSKFVSGINSAVSFIFNFSRLWKLFCEKFNVFGFDEISYKLKVIK